ncbi:Methionyl-tRNA formyltransferase [Arenibacter antarcticus]|uniref:Formyltransferase family protein n=1 Tax=Arenibacter antarcticus TaxID=2040469 RepID=A0ABW5VD80_9FLAO|nr:formyltransferase family protein [Arenibacter sp. H213]MCM4167880.1 methionyl-tRNA formyltransferase [Arenibacter sp. H213]
MLTFFLQGKKGLTVLKGYKEAYFKFISQIIIGTDSHVINDYSDEIVAFCIENSLRYNVSKKSNSFTTEYGLAIGWQYLIQHQHNQKLIVFHDSILPSLRGFNPLVTGLINGDKTIGVTALYASEEYDKGDIIDAEKSDITYPIKINKAIKIVAECYSRLANKIVEKIILNKPFNTTAQNENNATYSLWRDEEDYLINWNDCSEKISRFIDAVGYPYKGAMTRIGNKKIIVLEASVTNDVIIENRTVGKIIFKRDNNPVVVCGKGLLVIEKAVEQDGKEVDFKNKFRIRFK